MNDNKYLTSDWRSLHIHKLIAERFRANPEIVQKAIENIERWKKQNSYPQPYFDSWLDIIHSGIEPLLDFLCSESQEAQRLRSSSPFVGAAFITQKEHQEIFEKFRQNQ